jgi:signal transduction histidine kinase
MVSNNRSGDTLDLGTKVKVQFSLKWKISLIFSIVFSILFLLILEGITILVTKEADQQIKTDLTQALEGAASGVDVDMLIELAETGLPNEQGFSDDHRYLSLMQWLDDVHTAEPDAWPYLYVPSEKEGYIYFVVDLYAIYEPLGSSTFMEEYKSNSGFILIGLEEQTYRAVDSPIVQKINGWANALEEKNPDSDSWVAAGLLNFSNWLTESNITPKRDFGTYGDQFGRWASGYMPLENSNGEKVAGIGVDFQADMINQIRGRVRSAIQNVFLISYLFMLPIVFLISIKLTKPIVDLTEIATRIKTNDELVVFNQPISKNNKDEIDVLERVLFDTYEKLQFANLQLQGLSHQLISDREKYRTELARNLHDNVLSYLSVLSTNQQKDLDQETMRANYKQVIERLRATIFSLRSPMMEYGIPMALEDYLDSYNELAEDGQLTISLNLDPSDTRFDNTTETHIFRIVQQAFENALEHAKATEVTIEGEISKDLIALSIIDNGKGVFDGNTEEIDLEEYESRRKYGMVGMIERAALIGANIEIKAGLNGGTIVEINWQP